MHLSRFPALDHQSHLSARALTNQMMVNTGNGEKRRDWSSFPGHATVGENDDAVTFGDGGIRLATQLIQSLFEASPTHTRVEEHRKRG